MGKLRNGLVTSFACLLVWAAPAFCKTEVVGRGIADALGTGNIDIRIDPTADAVSVSNQLKTTLQLSHGGQVKLILAERGALHVKFAQAQAGALVEARLPEETRNTLAAVLLPGTAETAAVGTAAAGAALSTGLLTAGGATVATGGLVAGLDASGVIGGSGGARPPRPPVVSAVR